MFTRRQVIAASVVALLVVAGGLAYYVWNRDSDLHQVAQLQRQLLEGENLSRTARNTIKTQLFRTLDEMEPQKRRQLQRELAQQQRERMLTAVEKYQTATELEKTAILDQQLEEWQQMREIGAVVFRSGMRGGGRGGMRGGGRGGAGNPAGQNTGPSRPDRAPRDPRNADRPGMSDAQRAQFAQFMQDLRARAEQQGVELGMRRSRPPQPRQAPQGAG